MRNVFNFLLIGWLATALTAFGTDTTTTPDNAKPSAADRLKEIKSLYDQGLISKDVYDKKAKEITDSIPATLPMADGSIAATNFWKTGGIIQAGQFTPPPNRPGKSGYIELTHQRQELNLCVPTSASMVLEHFGRPTSPRELKVLSRHQIYDPAKAFNDFTMTLFPDLISGISTLGFSWQGQYYPVTHAGCQTGLTEIRKSIDKGNPVLIQTILWGGHTVVVAGYDDAAQNLIIMDPNIADPGIRVISYKDIEEIWNSRGGGFDTRGAIFTAPKS